MIAGTPSQRVVFLLVGGVLALLRRAHALAGGAPASADRFYLMLTAHGHRHAVFWIIFFEIAVLYFAGSVLLKCRLAAPALGLDRILR